MNIIHKLSPLIYTIFVKIISFFPAIPNSENMLFFRKMHNLFLSILSLIMLIGLIYGNYLDNKLATTYNFFCLANESYWTTLSVKTFLYSKYLEWLDTLFLVLSGKSISMLQYTHHMTTAILAFYNYYPVISPFINIFIILNCLVHVFMYWYFAYPKGYLHKFRRMITQLQIIQHIICLSTLIITPFINNCSQNFYGHILGFFMYSMYLFYFILFYLNKKKN
jgi:hypothetical protein